MIRSALIATLLLSIACGEPVLVTPPTAPGQVREAPSPTPDSQEPMSPEQAAQLIADSIPEHARVAYEDNDFVEVDVVNRDPFRGFASVFQPQTNAPEQVRVPTIMSETTVDQMRLIAVVTGMARPRAMLLDPSGVGHVVRVGNYVGRAEIIQSSSDSSMPVTLHWRVARIRPGEVVLSREDPTAPDRDPLTRVIPLYDEGEDPTTLRRQALREAEEEAERTTL